MDIPIEHLGGQCGPGNSLMTRKPGRPQVVNSCATRRISIRQCPAGEYGRGSGIPQASETIAEDRTSCDGFRNLNVDSTEFSRSRVFLFEKLNGNGKPRKEMEEMEIEGARVNVKVIEIMSFSCLMNVLFFFPRFLSRSEGFGENYRCVLHPEFRFFRSGLINT